MRGAADGRVQTIMTGRKDDGADGLHPVKDRWDLLPWDAVHEAVQVLTHGATKYGDRNWEGVDPERYFAALHRHVYAWRMGESLDPETKLRQAKAPSPAPSQEDREEKQ